ncbi:MAG: GNAT family N-acetyltransferase [Sediminibacterium sp.]|nr:GNAT family N-acetyltransferase [Sediminibacterium sp.]
MNHEIIQIRPASALDQTAVAPLIVQALDDLAAKYTNSHDPLNLIPDVALFFVQEKSMYSYAQTLVAETGNRIVGSVTAYDGADFILFRDPFIQHISRKYGFNLPLVPETEAGEYYMDTLSVTPSQQGKGIGAALIRAMLQHAAALKQERAGLLVEASNAPAKKLYGRIGFIKVGEKQLLNSSYEHLVFDLADL